MALDLMRNQSFKLACLRLKAEEAPLFRFRMENGRWPTFSWERRVPGGVTVECGDEIPAGIRVVHHVGVLNARALPPGEA